MLKAGAYKGNRKESGCKKMRNDPHGSEVVGRGVFPSNAKSFRRAGPHGRKTLRASLNFSPP
jgi:hypothetical protein